MPSRANSLRFKSDYHWLKNSPELINSQIVSSHMGQNLITAHELLSNATSLPDTYETEFKRLGIYFEKLVFEALRLNQNYRVLNTNYQVRTETRTLGEYDVILETLSKRQFIHVEVAVKFYLQLGQGDQLSHWVGPGLHDRLDLKYQRLLTHQLMLGEKALEAGCNDLPYVPTDAKALITRGRLYYPFDAYIQQRFSYPYEINDDHLKGFWMSSEQFNTYKQNEPDIRWYSLAKPFWLAEICAGEHDLLEPFEIDHLLGAKQVVAMADDKELMRGFVVTDDWLQRTRDIEQIA